MITSTVLAGADGVRHGFFTREGGVSGAPFQSLNCGYGSGDAPENVTENRARVARRLGVGGERFVTCYQVHSPRVVEVTRPWARDAAPQADAMVTREAGIALGVLSADCAPVLLADGEAGIVGAAHAGWRGALGGVIDATVAAMVRLGARCERLRAAVGPTIGPASYEVGPGFPDPFLAAEGKDRDLFQPAARDGHFLFDLPGYVERRLRRAGVARIENLPLDTAADERRFFSYRRARLRGEKDYGRLVSAIVLGG
jgi:hypothetical protein